MDNIRNDIVNDISAQISNKCNCTFFLPSNNTEVSIQSFNTSRYEDLGTLLLHASLKNCIKTHCAPRQALEDWHGGPIPHITVNNLTLLLLQDRNCPLYTGSLSSSECLPMEPQLPVTDGLESGSGNLGVTVAGALIGGIALGIALTVGVGLVTFFLLWYRRHHHDGKNAKMMKKIQVDSETPLSTRYIPANKNTNIQSNEDYEPVSVTAHDTEDPELENAYEPIGRGQPPAPVAATVKSTKVRRSNQKKKKNVNSDSASNETSGQKVIQEDAAGYVVPDVLWKGKQRPVASVGNEKSARVQKPDKRVTSTVSPSTAATTKTVEYDVPEGVDTSQSRTQAQPTSKVKGQGEQSSLTLQWTTAKEKSQQPLSSISEEQPSSGKGHHKQLQRLLQPAGTGNSQQESTSQVQQQLSSSQGKELTKPVQEGSKSNKKSKPNQQQNATKLAKQYQSESTNLAVTNTAKLQTHDTVKSKLQNLLSPMPAHGTANTPLSRQTSSSTVEKTKADSDSLASKVKAMASLLEGGGSTPSTASGSEISGSKSAGAKKK